MSFAMSFARRVRESNKIPDPNWRGLGRMGQIGTENVRDCSRVENSEEGSCSERGESSEDEISNAEKNLSKCSMDMSNYNQVA